MVVKKLREFNLFLRSHSVSIAVLVIVLAVTSTLGLLVIQQEKIQQEIVADQQILKGIQGITQRLSNGSATRTDQYNELNEHLDCLAAFFAEPNRVGETISDIDTCTLQDSKTGQATIAPNPSSAPTSSSPTTSSGITTQSTSKNLTSQNKAVSNKSLIDQINDFLKGL